MDYLYINAIVKETYLDLPCGCEFPDAYRKNLHRYISADDCLTNEAISKVITYFSVKEEGRAPLLVLANAERQKSCASVGRFVQCLGWEWDGKLIGDSMDPVFRSRFYNEEEINAMAEGKTVVPLPRGRRSDDEEPPISLDFTIKKAILTAVFLRWLRHEAVLRIAVPKNVDYIGYVWQTVKQIYAIFPVALRVEAGFCSYLPSVDNAASRVYIGFVPEDMADSRTLFLDGSRRSAITALEKGTGRELLDRFIEFLCGVDASTCHDFLEEVYEDLEGGGDGARITAVVPKNYLIMGEAVSLLTAQGDMESLLPRWQEFFSNPGKYSVKMRSRISEKIREQIEPDALCQMFRKKCADQKNPEEILKEMKSYEAFYKENQPLADALWESAVALMREHGNGYGKIYDCAASAVEKLSPAVNQNKVDDLFRMSMEDRRDALKAQQVLSAADADRLTKEAEALHSHIAQARETAYTADLLESIRGLISELKDKRNEFLYADFASRFETLKKEPAVNKTELKVLINKTQRLLADINDADQTEKISGLKENILGFLGWLQKKINDSDTKLNQLLEIITRGRDYFVILKELDKADKQLEADQLTRFYGELKKKRPASMEQYEALFENAFQRSFTLSSIANLSAYICWTVVRDICEFNAVPVAYSSAKSTAENVAEIDGAMYTARKISNACVVEVLFRERRWDSNWFREMLTMSHNAQSMGDRADFEKVFYTLVESGTYTGADLPGCIRMLNDCNLKYVELFKRIIEGRVRNCSEQQYIDTFEQIYENSVHNNKDFKLKSMENICKDLDEKDKVAYKAFRKFVEGNQKRKHAHSKLLVALLIGVSAVALCVILAIVCMLVFKKNDVPAPTGTTAAQVQTEPVPTEPERVEYPPVFQLLKNDGESVERLYGDHADVSFASYKEAVSNILSGEDQTIEDQIVEEYTAKLGTFVSIDGDGTQVAWDEYFFWVCWAYADAAAGEPQEAFCVDNFQEKACSILRAIYYNLPEQAAEETADEMGYVTAETTAISEEPVTEITVAAEEAVMESATEPEDAVVATEEEIGSTAEEILTAITNVAEASYKDAFAHARSLRLMLALFGADFAKSFDEHQALVESMLCTEDERAVTIIDCYHSLPEDSIVLFPEYDIQVSWREYMFWECWLMGRTNPVENTEEELHVEVLEILRVIHNLPEVKMEQMETASVEIVDSTQPSADQDETVSTEANSSEDTLPTKKDSLTSMNPGIAMDDARATFENTQRVYRAMFESIPVG